MMNTPPASGPITILVDADACPVKSEVYKVAARHGVKTLIVANMPLAIPRDPLVERVVVPAGLNAADDWIAERAGPADIVVTADIPLADRAVKAGAIVLAPDGRLFDQGSIGMALATRNLMEDLRAAGAVTGGPKPFSPRDRSAFLSALDQALRRLKRQGFAAS